MVDDPKFQKCLVFGPMARYVEDLVLAFRVMSAESKQNLRLDEPVDISKLNVLYAEDAAGSSGHGFGLIAPDEDIRGAMRRAAAHFEKNGAKVIRVRLRDFPLQTN